jgi:L-fucose isomerase-like protein
MLNAPEVKLGIVAVSRDCFPMELSKTRRDNVAKAFGDGLFVAQTIIENETDAMSALKELFKNGVNSLVVYLGNFGPEGPETMLAQKFAKGGKNPVMFVAAAEETGNNLINGRGDAYCGMLNASYNIGLRNIKAYIPEYPVGNAAEVAQMIRDFVPIARMRLGLAGLKIITFGPRPFDFLACNAPIKPLFDLGIEVQENSELDLLAAYNALAGDSRIGAVVEDMKKELGTGNNHPAILPKLAQFELTLLDWMEKNKGASKYIAFANKCWPAFQTQFGFVPCYVNSRLAARGIPVACETDIYGAVSEYILYLASELPPTLLDINNTVPTDLYEAKAIGDYKATDLFMGFHCGNTASQLLNKPSMEHQLIMKRCLEPDCEPNVSRGTLEGSLKASDVTLFRLQSTADCQLRSYIAQGEVLNVDPKSFGTIGVIAVKEMARFYRHVLIEKRYPHHAGVAFSHVGKPLYEFMKLMGICDVAYNKPAGVLYDKENPF